MQREQEEDEEDDVWADEAVAAVFAEEADDEGYETEKSEEDLADSDFWDSESEDDGEGADGGADDDEPRKKKKVMRPPGAGTAARRQQMAAQRGHGSGPEAGPSKPRAPRAPTPKVKTGEERRSRRALAVAATAARAAAVAEAEANARAAMLKRKKRKKEPEVVLTQADLLAEAAVTEVYNRRLLSELMQREEETKRKAVKQKVVYTGPMVRTVDSARTGEDGKRAERRTVEFSGVDRVPCAINSKAPPPPRVARCVVSGKPARYFDPKTQQPYHGIEEFKVLRATAAARR